MAIAIVANALVFHSLIATVYGPPSPEECRAVPGRTFKGGIGEVWDRIPRGINYWPIFRIASDLLAHVDVPMSDRILGRLTEVAGELVAVGATSMNDLSGRMFQRIIGDRQFLATFYSLPSSSALFGTGAEVAAARRWRCRTWTCRTSRWRWSS